MSQPVSPTTPHTPKTPWTPGTPFPSANTQAVGDLLTMMKSTLSTLGQTFDSLGEQSAKVATLGPALDSAHQIQQLRRQMRSQEKHQEKRINDVKYIVTDVLKVQIADHMRAQIADQIRSEIALQVKEQVAAQIKDHLPISLEDQAREAQQQLASVRNSLTNSEARRANAMIQPGALEDPLAKLVREDGTVSPIFPADLKSLFLFDAAKALRISQEYGLPEHVLREGNLNRFMAHCGVSFHLIPMGNDDNDMGAVGFSTTMQ